MLTNEHYYKVLLLYVMHMHVERSWHCLPWVWCVFIYCFILLV